MLESGPQESLPGVGLASSRKRKKGEQPTFPVIHQHCSILGFGRRTDTLLKDRPSSSAPRRAGRGKLSLFSNMKSLNRGTRRKWVKAQEAWGHDLSLPGAHTARLPFLLAPTQLRETFGSHCGLKRHLNIDVSPDKSFL